MIVDKVIPLIRIILFIIIATESNSASRLYTIPGTMLLLEFTIEVLFRLSRDILTILPIGLTVTILDFDVITPK
jgi:hypothetical protein